MSIFSIDRFDAYGDYEYIDIERHPSPIQFHKPLPHRPQTLHQHHEHLPVAQPIRRLDYQVRQFSRFFRFGPLYNVKISYSSNNIQITDTRPTLFEMNPIQYIRTDTNLRGQFLLQIPSIHYKL